MNTNKFFEALQKAETISEVEKALQSWESEHENERTWVPVGNRENNRGVIEVSSDPGRSLVERLTNGVDAVLEAEHQEHKGLPNCRSPKEAATAWLNIPENGLSELTTKQRRELAQRVSIKVLSGESRDSRMVEVRDLGIGISPEDMPKTILSLNESNKVQKHYLAGTYGQGGSSTFAASKYVFMATRRVEHPTIGFTIVKFLDLPPEQYKTGHYVYLTLNKTVLQMELPQKDFPSGTQIKHFGYDLSKYPSPLGPNSVYGLLNEILFDPIIPVWFDNQVHDYRRVIKGSRNALNGAVDDGDEGRSDLSHKMKIFYVELADFGRIGIEYWVLDKPENTSKKPSAAFVNPNKPIILTLHGQNHAEFFNSLIRKDAELPYLGQRLICHIDCNFLKAEAKRALFSSTREDVRVGIVYELIQKELIKVLRSDDELTRLNNEARQQSIQTLDASALQQMRREVARILRLQGIDIGQMIGGEVEGTDSSPERPTHPRPPRPQPEPIQLKEPPTYIKILGDEDEAISFYPEQRKYVRVETDANSNYHSLSQEKSRINFIVSGEDIKLKGSTSLSGGRMRAIFESLPAAKIGNEGVIRVELSRQGLPTLTDEKRFKIVEPPPVRPGSHRVTLPPFELHGIDPSNPLWGTLDWPDNTNLVASSYEMDAGKMVIYYSKVFPKYATTLALFERRDTTLAESFTKRYEIWLAVHSLLMYQDQQAANATESNRQEDPEIANVREREERCRVATLSALFAAREVQSPSSVIEED